MNLLIDAQLTRRLTHELRAAGFKRVPTLYLPDGNRTAAQTLNTLSLIEQCVVVMMDFFRRALDVVMRLTNLRWASMNGCFGLKTRRAASAFVTVYDDHLGGQAFLKHSSCGLVESLTTQMTTDEPKTSAEARAFEALETG